MRSRSIHVGLLAVAALIAAVVAAPVNATTYSAVQATGTEYHVVLSRAYVAPGKLRVEFVNFGQDDHDLAITRKKGGATTKLSVVHPGQRGVVTITTHPGSYVLWCTLSDHKAKGMRAVLRVKS
jgi:plastocyanin